MSRRRGRIAALLTLGSLAIPWLLSAAVAVHEAQHHYASHLAESDVALALDLASHGHHHDRGTPAHQHLIAPARVVRLPVAKASLNVAPLALGGVLVSPPALATPGRWSSLTLSGPGHDPPSFLGTHSVLRI